MKHIVCAALLLLGCVVVSGKSYKVGDEITLFANKVGPFQNPTETYQFYNLPFCQPAGGKEYKIEDLGEASGSHLCCRRVCAWCMTGIP